MLPERRDGGEGEEMIEEIVRELLQKETSINAK